MSKQRDGRPVSGCYGVFAVFICSYWGITSSPTGSHWSALRCCFETEMTEGWKISPPQICKRVMQHSLYRYMKALLENVLFLFRVCVRYCHKYYDNYYLNYNLITSVFSIT